MNNINLRTFILILLSLSLSSCSILNSRGISSISEVQSCSSSIQSLIKSNAEVSLQKSDLDQLKNIDEVLFEKYKLERIEDLRNGWLREYRNPLDKIAHLEAIIEYRMKFPVQSGMISQNKRLSDKKIIKLSKILEDVDFNEDWTYKKYRKFIFKYYSIMNSQKETSLNIDSFKEATLDFIIKRTEQQILMNHIAPNISVVSKLRNRTKLFLSIFSNIMMIHNVGTFYTFYELRLFTPNDLFIEKIYKNGLLDNMEELKENYRLRATVEYSYNKMRPYLILTGIATTAMAIANAYSNGEDLIEESFENYSNLISDIMKKFSSLLSDTQRALFIQKLEQESKNHNSFERENYVDAIEMLKK